MNMSSRFSLTDIQEALSFAYIAYSGYEFIGNHLIPSVIAHKIKDSIDFHLNDAEYLNNDWEVVWGPAFYTFDDDLFQDNLLFVSRQKSNPKNLLIAVRGTNPISLTDWVREDFLVRKKEAWIGADKEYSTGKEMVSRSTHIGLDIILNKLVPEKGIPGEGVSLTQFLTKSEVTGLRVTGHSLGGSLAPVLALWLRQYQGVQKHWDPGRNAEVSSIFFAGPTPGNSAFARYYSRMMGDDSLSIANSMDIVTHAWENDALQELPTLYESQGIKLNFAEKEVLKLVVKDIHDYEHLSTRTDFTGELNSGISHFLKQALNQHVYSYPKEFGCPELAKILDPLGLVS